MRGKLAVRYFFSWFGIISKTAATTTAATATSDRMRVSRPIPERGVLAHHWPPIAVGGRFWM